MKFNHLKKWIRDDRENAAFLLLLIVMAFYYAYRLFALTPWYDELYTYYYFISRGPIYAAIHWPVPNNHVGYSVLSAVLNLFGNASIGLRGVSYLCALWNLLLIYRIGKTVFEKWISLMVVLLYLSMNLVNQLAVQGRGYTLGITCFLAATYSLIQICENEMELKRWYWIFFGSLLLALYAVPSHVYFVVPVCIAGGIYLLVTHKISRLFRLIISSVLAALGTSFLYAVIWLAIGSNLLVKEESSLYFGMRHLDLIRKAPLAAFKRGIDYMLATPYIQSVSREGFFSRLRNWFQTLLNYYYDGLWLWLLVILLCTVVILIWKLKTKFTIFPLLLLLTGAAIPLFLIIQCKLPYYRVFAYGGALMAFMMGYFLQAILQNKGMVLSGMIFVLFFASSKFLFGGYQNSYGEREELLKDALLRSNAGSYLEIRVTDCTEQYLLKFLYGKEIENQQIEGADYLLLDKKMLDESYQEMEWEFYHYYNTIPWEYIENEMRPVYENAGFVAYVKE